MSRFGPRDRVDLSIPLREKEKIFFERSHAQLQANGGLLEHNVSFSGDFLFINAVDLISVLSYAETALLSELELRSLQRKLERAISALELNATSASTRAHYIWCKTALRAFRWGRHTEESEE